MIAIEELDGIETLRGVGDVARAWGAKARATALEHRRENAKLKEQSGEGKQKAGPHFGDKNNFTGKLGDKYVAYVNGKKVGTFDSREEAEKAYNGAGGPDKKGNGAPSGKASTANQREDRGGSSSGPKAGDAITSKTASVGQKVELKGGGEGVIKTAPTKDGNVDVEITSGPNKGMTMEYGADDGTLKAAGSASSSKSDSKADSAKGDVGSSAKNPVELKGQDAEALDQMSKGDGPFEFDLGGKTVGGTVTAKSGDTATVKSDSGQVYHMHINQY